MQVRYYVLIFFFVLSKLSAQTSEPFGSCEDGINKATKDAAKGKYEVLSYGLPFYDDWDFQWFYEKYILKKYGIIIGNGGCVVYEETDCYADRMREIVYEKFGYNIFDQARNEAMILWEDSCKVYGYPFTSVDTLPEFKGGEKAMYKFLEKNLVDPDINDSIQGKIYVKFTIDEEGRVQNVFVIKGISGKYDQEVVRVLSLMPIWKPGIYKGRKVKVSFNMPFVF